MNRSHHVRLPLRRPLQAVVILAFVAVALNVLEVWRVPGGPLEAGTPRPGQTPGVVAPEQWAAWERNGVRSYVLTRGSTAILGETWMRLDWGTGARIERVDPVWDADAPSVSDVRVRVGETATADAPAIAPDATIISRGRHDGGFAEPPADVAPTSCCEPANNVLVTVRVDRPGTFRLAGFWIDYAVGRLAFRMFALAGDTFRIETSAG